MSKLLVTRLEFSAARFVRAVQEGCDWPIDVILSPVMRIDPIVPAALPAPGSIMIFTSVHGVDRAADLGIDPGPAFCVGDRTAKAARDAGFDAQSAQGNADALIGLIHKQRPSAPLVHIRGEHSLGAVAMRLTSAGLPCSELVTYRQAALKLSDIATNALKGVNPVILPLFSPRSAWLVFDQCKVTAPLRVIAMSDSVAAEARNHGFEAAEIAATPDMDAMLAATCRQMIAAR